jgi:hypothetical protein
VRLPSWADVRGFFARALGDVSDQESLGEAQARRRAKRIKMGVVAFGTVLVSAIVAMLGAGPWVKQRVVAEAAERGVELRVGEVVARPFSVTLKDVEATPIDMRNVRVRFASIHVALRVGLSIESVTAEEGIVTVSGSVEEVREALGKWRDKYRKPRAEPTAQRSETRYLARGVDLAWSGAFGDNTTQSFSGLQLERTADSQRLGVDHVELQRPDGSVEVAGVTASWKRGATALELEKAEVAVARVRARLEAERDAREEPPAAAPGAPLPGTEPSAEGVKGPKKKGAKATSDDDEKALQAAREKARELAASEGGLLGRLPPVDEGRGVRLRALLGSVIDELGARVPERTLVKALWLEVERGQQKLHLGPSTLELLRSPADLKVVLSPHGEAKGTPLSVRAELPRQAGPLHLRLEGGPVSLATLGVREGDFGLVGVGTTELGGLVDVLLSASGDSISVEGDVRTEHVTLDVQRIAPRPVAIERMRLIAKAKMATSGARYALEKSELAIGEASFQLAGELERGVDHVAAKVRGGTPLVACQALLDSAPRGLLDRVEQMKMEGTLSLDVGLEFDTKRLGAMQVRFDLKNDCRITEVPQSLSTQRFRGPFEHEVLGPDGMPMVVQTGPGTGAWTRADAMPPYLETAALVCEDGRFFGHKGFDARAIESSIRDNVSAGRFLRGASTITMQLAKNLYLSRDKQLSRKFQEAGLTLLLEQELSKAELLELYFNIVEFGPGVYGVRQAAQHYFGTSPDQLTVAQSFFLISILPNPKRSYFDEAGHLLPARATYLQRLMNIAYDRGKLTDTELARGLSEELRLGPPVSEAPEAPLEGQSGMAPRVPSLDLPSATPGRAAPVQVPPGAAPNAVPAAAP